MFKINVSVKPENLPDEMLVEEIKNIGSICQMFKKVLNSHLESDIPEFLTFRDKHAMFFIDKGRYTEQRYIRLKDECYRRGIITTDISSKWNIYLNTSYYNDYTPSDKDKEMADVYTKFIIGNKWSNYAEDDYVGEPPFHFYGKPLTFAALIKLVS